MKDLASGVNRYTLLGIWPRSAALWRDNHRSNIEHIQLPQYDRRTVDTLANRTIDPTNRLSLLDSRVCVEFSTADKKPRSILVATAGHPAYTDCSANKTPVKVALAFIEARKPGPLIGFFSMSGTPLRFPTDKDYRYNNSLPLFNFADPQRLANITNFFLRDYDCLSLPRELFLSIDLSSIRFLSVVQYLSLEIVWGMFILSPHATVITNLFITNYDMGKTLSQGFTYCFEALCRSFSTPTTLNIKSTVTWPLDVDALGNHSQLRVANLDLGTNLSVTQLQMFQQNHPKLEEIIFRDEALASPLHSTRATATNTIWRSCPH